MTIEVFPTRLARGREGGVICVGGWVPDSGRRPRRLLGPWSLGSCFPVGQRRLTPFAPSVMDQNGCGSCTGHGASRGFATAYAVAGEPLFGLDLAGRPVACSQLDLYAGGRGIDRAAENPGLLPEDLPALIDRGSEVLAVVEFAAWFGLRPTRAPIMFTDAYTGQKYKVNSDCVPENVTDEIDFVDLECDVERPVPLAHQISSIGSRRIIDACLALDAGYPIIVGGWVDDDFVRYSGGVVGEQDEGDPNGGGHCMLIEGYDTVAGKRVFDLGNSWGTGWGEDGMARVGEDFVAQLSELFAVVPGKTTTGKGPAYPLARSGA